MIGGIAMTDRELKNFHVDTIAQYKVLRHISAEFLPEGIASLQENDKCEIGFGIIRNG